MLCFSPMTFATKVGSRSERSPRPRYARLVLSLLSALYAVASIFAAADARAQAVPAVTGIIGKVQRLTAQNQDADSYATGYPHPGGVALNVINYQDCEADLGLDFTLGLSGTFANYDLVAWAGPSDCTPVAAREGSAPTCWPLTPVPIPQNGGAADAGVATATFKLLMRDMVSHAFTNAGAATYSRAGEDVCTQQPSSAAQAETIYFFFVDRIGSGNAIGYFQPYPIVVDTQAQNVSTAFQVAEALDSQLTVTILATAESDTVSWNIYCDPQPGHETAANQAPFDAGAPTQCLDSAVASVGPDSSDAKAEASPEAEASIDAAADARIADAAGSADDGSGPADDAGLADASGDGAGLPDASPLDGAIADSAVVDSAVAPLPDDAGGTTCSIPANDAGVPGYSCTATSILQPGGGSAVPEQSADGGILRDDSGAAVYVDGGALVGGRPTLGIPAANLCGTLSASSNSFTMTGLRDGFYYTIAVAAVDTAGNVGPLGVTCGSPVELADFWYNYTSAGGQAGGGFCSAAEGVGVPAGTGGLGLLMVASIIAMVRKRRRR